jgi:hypothetical protein
VCRAPQSSKATSVTPPEYSPHWFLSQVLAILDYHLSTRPVWLSHEHSPYRVVAPVLTFLGCSHISRQHQPSLSRLFHTKSLSGPFKLDPPKKFVYQALTILGYPQYQSDLTSSRSPPLVDSLALAALGRLLDSNIRLAPQHPPVWLSPEPSPYWVASLDIFHFLSFSFQRHPC